MNLPMKKKTPRCLRTALRNRRAGIFFLSAAMPLLLLLAGSTTFAGDAQWNLTPGSNDWNTAGNWTPTTVPNGGADTAMFNVSNTTDVLISGVFSTTEVNGIVFNAGASAFRIGIGNLGVHLTISGVGITNNSGTTQNFVVSTDGCSVDFTNNARAGRQTVFTVGGGPVTQPGTLTFGGNSSADHGTFIVQGGVTGAFISFGANSTADHGMFVMQGGAGGPSGNSGGRLSLGNGSAGNGTFINNGGLNSGTFGGSTSLSGSMSLSGTPSLSNAGIATFVANGGSNGGGGGAIYFSGDSTARMEVFGNGFLELRGGGTVGSIEGDGNVFLGGNNLAVGSNNVSTTFSGVIQDGGSNGGIGGSLTKIGAGTLALSGSNAYTGGTTVNAGTLLVNNTSGSGTGSGAVQVNAGTLGGSGTIAGAVTVGTGSGRGASLSPGQSAGTLTIQGALTLNSDATYKFELDRSTMTADEVIANGVTINGAKFSFTDIHRGAFARGTVLSVIDNTAVSLIAGAFVNLPDGSTFKSKGNTFEVSYEGGDGNDLTLTAIKGKKSRRTTFAFSNESSDVNDLTVTAIAPVPEPSSWVLIATGAIMLMAFMRFGSRKSSSSA
jgi:autotransporter-associated beta strand protein